MGDSSDPPMHGSHAILAVSRLDINVVVVVSQCSDPPAVPGAIPAPGPNLG